jgi:hypothetical protein
MKLFSIALLFAFALVGQTPAVLSGPIDLTPQASDPPACYQLGTRYFNTTSNVTRVCTSTGTPGTWANLGGGTTFNPSDLTSLYWRDVLTNGTQSANCTFNYFQTGGNTGGATYAYQSVDLNHTPTCRVTTGATSGNDLAVYLSANTTPAGQFFPGLNSVSGAQAWEFVALVRLPTITNVGAKVCVTGSTADTGDTVVNGICARFSTNASDTTWKLDTCASSTCTAVDSTVTVVANTWYKIRIDSSVSGTIGLTVNSAARVTSSTNIPSASLVPELTLKTYTAASTSMDVSAPLVFDITGLTKP